MGVLQKSNTLLGEEEILLTNTALEEQSFAAC